MDGECASEDTPKKFQTNTGCVFCGCELADSRKRTRLNGKVADLRNRICNILDIPLSSVNMDSYICNERCYRDVKRLEKIREDIKILQHSLKEKFTANNRPKRGVPSDSSISPSVAAPSKSLRQATDEGRRKAAIRLSFGEIRPKPSPMPVQLPAVWPIGLVQDAPLVKDTPEVHCEGDICEVQVSAN